MIAKSELLTVLAANNLTLDSDIISGYVCHFIAGLPSGCPELMFDEASGVVVGRLDGEMLAPIVDIKDLTYYFETCAVKPIAYKDVASLSLYNLSMQGFLDMVSTDFQGKVYGIPSEFVQDGTFSVTSVKETDKGRFVIAQRSADDFTYYFAPKVGGKVRWLARKDWPKESGDALL